MAQSTGVARLGSVVGYILAAVPGVGAVFLAVMPFVTRPQSTGIVVVAVIFAAFLAHAGHRGESVDVPDRGIP